MTPQVLTRILYSSKLALDAATLRVSSPCNCAIAAVTPAVSWFRLAATQYTLPISNAPSRPCINTWQSHAIRSRKGVVRSCQVPPWRLHALTLLWKTVPSIHKCGCLGGRFVPILLTESQLQHGCTSEDLVVATKYLRPKKSPNMQGQAQSLRGLGVSRSSSFWKHSFWKYEMLKIPLSP